MYSAWAIRRRLQYQLSILAFFGLVAGIAALIYFHEPPTCFDGKQNQNELGVDCAGLCEARCAFEVRSLSTLWVRPFEVTTGYWTAAAYVENPNLDSLAERVPYVFKLYDAENALIGERRGETFITGQPIIPIFLPGINTGGKEVKRAFFEWEAPIPWKRLHKKYDIDVSERRTEVTPAGQTIKANVKNNGPQELRNIEAVALVFDLDGSVMAASRTYIDYMPPFGVAEVLYTWPRPFSFKVGPIEIIPRVPVQES